MTNAVYGTTTEKKIIAAIQGAVGAKEDGILGPQTVVDLAVRLGVMPTPATISLYGFPCIICRDILPFAPYKPLSAYANSISGSFNDGGQPCSVLVADGKAVCEISCHYWQGYPETVIYRTSTGAVGQSRVKTVGELPAGVAWAVGGMGLMDMYNPTAEGFAAFTYSGKRYDFSDVLRCTGHTVLGVKNGLFYLFYIAQRSAAQINVLMRDTFKMDMAILLDGGHVSAINGGESFARKNTGTKQLYAIQAVM